MADSVRQIIMSAIDTRLKEILVSGGYETNIGLNVFDWRNEPLEEGDLPALIYRDVACATEITSLNHFVHRLSINILAAVSGSTPMATIRKIIADIDEAIGKTPTWGGYALNTERISDESEIQIGDKKYAGCQISILVTFRTLGWDDFTKV